jgi:hypothetical protein
VLGPRLVEIAGRESFENGISLFGEISYNNENTAQIFRQLSLKIGFSSDD